MLRSYQAIGHAVVGFAVMRSCLSIRRSVDFFVEAIVVMRCAMLICDRRGL